MPSTRSIRQHQIEVGVITHNGHEFVAFGATVVRKDITAYVKYKRGHCWLTTWTGGTMLDCRSEVIERFWNGGLALMFRLSQSRFIVGYRHTPLAEQPSPPPIGELDKDTREARKVAG